jgi:hypothetical protein
LEQTSVPDIAQKQTPEQAALRKALESYDPAFEAKLVEQIASAIVEASFVDAGAGHSVLALRLGEIASALTTMLANVLALSPAAARSPTAIREITDGVRRQLVARVRQAERDPEVFNFKARTFNDSDPERGGRC